MAIQSLQSIDWVALAPTAITAAAALAVLVADLFVPAARKPLLGWTAVGGLVLAGLSLLPLLSGARATFCLTSGGGPGAGARPCSYVADHFTLVIQLLVIAGALLTALISMHGPDDLPAGEYWFLLLASAAGAALLPASRDLATLVVALEVTSLPAFALVGLRRGDRLSGEAALKFFLSSVTATAVMLLGVSFVYAATGSLHLATIGGALTHTSPQLAILAKTGVVLTLIGFAFKLAVAPFHFWVPDTYTGAPIPVAAYLSVVGKAAGFSGIILLTVIAFRAYADVWAPALAVLAALTMTAGNTAALRQRPGQPRSAVRLLAWSSVGQAGYLLVPLAAAGFAGSGADAADPARRIGATVAYALMYGVVNLGAFAVASLVARTSARAGISDYRGLAASRPLTALAMAFFLLCLAGLPPGVIGLFAKVVVFSSAMSAGLGWLAVVMGVNVAIALCYYLRWVALLFVRRSADEVTGKAAPVPAAAPVPLTAAIGLTAVAGLVLSGAPQLVLRFASGGLF